MLIVIFADYQLLPVRTITGVSVSNQHTHSKYSTCRWRFQIILISIQLITRAK